MNKDYWELNDELDAEKEAILDEAEREEAALEAKLEAYDEAVLADYLATQEDNRRDDENLMESAANAEMMMVETHPELFEERSMCCEAELYDDNEFCVECLKRDPEIMYVRKSACG